MRIAVFILLLASSAQTLLASDSSSQDEARVTLPLDQYHALTERIEAARIARETASDVEEAVHAISSLHLEATVDGDLARLLEPSHHHRRPPGQRA